MVMNLWVVEERESELKQGLDLVYLLKHKHSRQMSLCTILLWKWPC